MATVTQIFGTEGPDLLYGGDNITLISSYGGNDTIINSRGGVWIDAGTDNNLVSQAAAATIPFKSPRTKPHNTTT